MFDFSKYFAMIHSTFNQHSNGPMISTAERAIEYDSTNVIEIRDAYKRYSSCTVVFQGLNMTVKKGTIYGLLGPSGCGKTTLLSCITGISSLDAGNIILRCTSRRQMGYMPQEAALMERFKVSELLHYFGHIHGMETIAVTKRAKELLLLVSLPPNEFYHLPITSLSGGQLRRISLLVALIHNPDLLILDEPTVGLDPITRFSLWEYFVRETEENNKTIIITTHYIEEARQSHKIGLMRGGVLLAEESPKQLLIDCKCSSLEDVFLLLSRSQANSTNSEEKPYPPIKPPTRPFSDKCSVLKINRLIAQTKKNFYWIKRNIGMMIYMLLLPGVMCFLFCTVYRNELQGVHIAAVSEESCVNYTYSLQADCGIDIRISCLYLQHMRDKGYTISEYSDLPSGLSAVRQGQSLALLYFNQNYTSALMDLIMSSITFPPEPETLQLCELKVTMDMTEMLKAGRIRSDIQDAYKDIRKEIYISCDLNPRSVNDPINVAEPVYGQLHPDFTHNALAGFIIPFVFYLTTTYTSTAALSDKSSGVLRRSFACGLTKLEMGLAHSLIQLIIMSAQNFTIVLILYGIFHNPMNGNLLVAFAFIITSELQGMLYGFFLSAVIDHESHLTYTAIGTILILFLTSGMIWPTEGMVPALKNTVHYSPWTKAVDAYRSVSIRGWGLQDASVYNAFTYNIATVIIMVVINIIAATMVNKSF